MSGPRVRRDEAGGVVTLTLDRPDKLNALDAAAFAELDARVAELEAAPPGAVRCVLLRGAGRSFCAGADLGSLEVATPETALAKSRVLRRFELLPMPTVAVVQGHCIAGGIELMLCADLVVAAEDAVLADAHGRHGLVPAWGLTARLPRRIGYAGARLLMFTGRAVSGTEAHALGLVDLVAPPGDLDAVSGALAADIAAGSWVTATEVKRLLREGEALDRPGALAAEHARQELSGSSTPACAAGPGTGGHAPAPGPPSRARPGP
ncbi:enoyl-CoA hydratase/isomerase family protein [Nocardioides carbamazepini]|uniref:enoyl-CoA hydratase/isomerase family protein n=1 Tax=Nocardioides carbamazepini TaxID=2854259 RepID=UPI002149FECB|nr:enoyl-CoA hydratase/isomerase family protein [Nocardioides carbamazepini]MCR1785045.1 enoyl-CoA hydratase/isomerase family protein [Nocardioides carbamazepini]